MREDRLPEFHFNPRSREGSDPKERALYNEAKISIYAPVKGATCADHGATAEQLTFQSTLP